MHGCSARMIQSIGASRYGTHGSFAQCELRVFDIVTSAYEHGTSRQLVRSINKKDFVAIDSFHDHVAVVMIASKPRLG